MKNQDKIFDKVTSQIINLMDEGHIPWQKPWNVLDVPTNGLTGKTYSGFNLWFLSLVSSFKYSENVFVGYKQAQKLGGNVKKGESGWAILVPSVKYFDSKKKKYISKKKAQKLIEEEGEQRVSQWMQYYYNTVFNIDQCENIDQEELAEQVKTEEIDFQEIQQASEIWEQWTNRPPLTHRGGRAYYTPSLDEIVMPNQNKFVNEEEYYSTLFHEMIHATGSQERLSREKGDKKGDEKYSFEELIAEIGSAFLCGMAGIEKKTIENSAGYIQHWKQKLEEDNQLIIKAVRKAREAVEYISENSAKIDRKKVA